MVCRQDEWICADGTCARSHRHCNRNNNTACVEGGHPYKFWCPHEKLCRDIDYECLRVCSSEAAKHNYYSIPCRAYPGLCSVGSSFRCPDYCPYQVRCLDGKCVDHLNFCKRCSGLRCQSNGMCYSFKKRCNQIYDCPDWSDEKGCPGSVSNTTVIEPHVIGMIVGVILTMIVLVVAMVIRYRVRRGKCPCCQPTPQFDLDNLQRTLENIENQQQAAQQFNPDVSAPPPSFAELNAPSAPSPNPPRDDSTIPMMHLETQNLPNEPPPSYEAYMAEHHGGSVT